MANQINLFEYLRAYQGRCSMKFVKRSPDLRRNFITIYDSARIHFANLEVELIEEANYKALRPEDLRNDLHVFVLEKFALGQVVLPNSMLLGLPLINMAIETRNVMIPENTTQLFCNALFGYKICLEEDLFEDELARVRSYVSWMQGTIGHNIEQGSILIASKVPARNEVEGAPSLFRQALDQDIPIYHVNLLSEMLSNFNRNPFVDTMEALTNKMFSGFLLSPFEKLVVCGDYLRGNSREQIRRLVVCNKGIFRELFDLEDLTQVIVLDANARRRVAEQAINMRFWQFVVVSTQWVIDSAEAKRPQPFERYAVHIDMFENTGELEDVGAGFHAEEEIQLPHFSQVEQFQQEAHVSLEPIHEPVQEQDPSQHEQPQVIDNQEEFSLNDDEEPVQEPSQPQQLPVIDNQEESSSDDQEASQSQQSQVIENQQESSNDDEEEVQEAPRATQGRYRCDVAGCPKGFTRLKALEHHKIVHHGLGKIFLCSCGYLSAGPVRKEAHELQCRKIGRALTYYVNELKQQNEALLGYAFNHKKSIAITTNNAGKYTQIGRNDKATIMTYIAENISRLNTNQRVFNRLWDQNVREAESDDELGLDVQ